MFVQIFQNRIQKRKNIVETEREYYLSVIFGDALEYFRILFFSPFTHRILCIYRFIFFIQLC